MAEEKKRSGIFKFFYVVLSIITFPIFAVFFILRHPLWIVFILLVLAGGAYYYPIKQGVKPDEVISWYQKKYSDVKIEVVNKALESGTTDYLPKSIVDDVKKIEEDAKEAQLPKSENYNDKVVRDTKGEETKDMIKKRGGFKKKNEPKDEVINSEELKSESLDEVDVLTEGAAQAGGLSALLKSEDEIEEDESVEEEVKEISESVNESVTEEVSESKEKVIETKETEPVTPEATPDVVDEKPLLPEPAAEPVKPVIPEPAAEDKKPASNDDDLEMDLF